MSKSKTCTDAFRFEGQRFFEELRKSLANDTPRKQNLIECKDDMLFGWNSVECCLVVFNWRLMQSKTDGSVDFQTLIPSKTVDFAVEKLTASNEGQFIALSGSRGVAILELPTRYGPNGQYKEGKSKIFCNTNILDEQFFCSNPHVSVQQARWHPASPKDCNLIVLLSNNSIRVYDEYKLHRIWKIGPTPRAVAPTKTSLTYLNSLGDTAIDFDIAAPRVVVTEKLNATFDNDVSINSSTILRTGQTKYVEWPLVILWGNGNLYVALISFDTEKPRLQGPLSIFPQAKDNYGLDSCAILALRSNPTTIVVAEPSGKLFHMILIETEAEESSQDDLLDEAGIKYEPCEWMANVIEVVELELGLTGESNSDNFSICLKADVNNDSRYYAYHTGGLHAITIDFMQELDQFFNNDLSIESTLSKPSHAEYVVCTVALESAKPNTVVGFALLQSPSGLVLFLSSGQVVSLNTITNPSYLRNVKAIASTDETDKPAIDSQINSKVFSGSFEESIRQLLASGTSQPILKLNGTKDVSPKESIKLLIDAFQLMRDQYINKHDKVRQKLENRVKILRILEEKQRQEIAELIAEKQKIRENAERLAEMYEESNDRQQNLLKKLHELLRLVNARVPGSTIADRNFAEQIEKLSAATKDLANNILLAKKKSEKHDFHQSSGDKKPSVALPPQKEKAVKEILAETHGQIEAQIKEIKRIKSILQIE